MAFTEFYTNRGSCVLLSAYTAGDTSIHVSSTTGDDSNFPFPVSTPFRLSLYTSSNVFCVLLKVTAITDGTHFATTPEGHDANAANGSTCYGVQTAASLTAIRTDAGTVANLTGLGTNVGTFLGTPSSANLAAALTDETGSGPAVFATSPTFTGAITAGTDNSAAGTLQLANGSANAHTIFSSAATTTNTIAGFATVPTTGHLVDVSVSSTTATLHDSGVATANVVNASSPGVGIAHFAGSTQTVTSSLIVAADITSATITGTQLAASLALVTPLLGTPTSGDASNLTNIPVANAKSGSVLPGANGGGWVLLETHSASSSASLDFTTCFSSSYDKYKFEIVSILPATASVNFWIRYSTDGGSTYNTGSNYAWSGTRQSTVPDTVATGSNSDTAVSLTVDGTSGGSILNGTAAYSGSLTLYDPLNASLFKNMIWTATGAFNASFNASNLTASGWFKTATAVNAVRFVMRSGNIASGTIYCYGAAKT